MNYEVRLTDLAIICATIVGPILAVQAQKIVESWREERARRDRIFKTLMATRAARLAPNHIESLNMINIEFPAIKRFRKTRSAWKAYLLNLGETIPDETQQPVFFTKRNDLFTDLLYEMGTALGYDFDKTEISREVYSTLFHEKAEAELNTIRGKMAEVLNGKATLPMSVVHLPVDEDFAKSQREYMKIMVANLNEGKPMPVTIVNTDSVPAKVIPLRQAEQADEDKTA